MIGNDRKVNKLLTRLPILVVCILVQTLLSAQGEERLPQRKPDIQGIVTQVSRSNPSAGFDVSTILIREDPKETLGLFKADVTIHKYTTWVFELYNNKAIPVTHQALEIGQRVMTWFERGRNLTYPVHPIRVSGQVVAIIRESDEARRKSHDELPRHAIRISRHELALKLVGKVEPSYPEEAKLSRPQGRVLLEVLVNEKGRVEDAAIIRGHSSLRKAALNAVRQWRYEPILLREKPISVVATVTINFRNQ